MPVAITTLFACKEKLS